MTHPPRSTDLAQPLDLAAAEQDLLGALMTACGLEHTRRGPAEAAFQIKSANAAPTGFVLQSSAWFVTMRATVELGPELGRLPSATLDYINAFNQVSPLGASRCRPKGDTCSVATR